MNDSEYETQQGFFGWHVENGHEPQIESDGGVSCNCGETYAASEAVTDAESELIRAEQWAGYPIPDISEPGDVATWRAEHQAELSSPEALAEATAGLLELEPGADEAEAGS